MLSKNSIDIRKKILDLKYIQVKVGWGTDFSVVEVIDSIYSTMNHDSTNLIGVKGIFLF